MVILNSKNPKGQKLPDIGRIFTPLSWAKWCVQEFHIYDRWRQGKKIIDPTCGNGVFFLAMFDIAQERNESISASDLLRLTGVEICLEDKWNFLKASKDNYNIAFSEKNFVVGDFFDYSSMNSFDIAVGNPPWVNYTDLSTSYKDKIKDLFIKFGLVKNKKDVLLGASRIDVAALVLMKVMSEQVISGGDGYFFVPLSLFFNEDANKHLRPKQNTSNIFSVEQIIGFEKKAVFENVSTKNGFVHLKSGKMQSFPVPMKKLDKNSKLYSSWCYPTADNGAWVQTNDKYIAPKFHVISVEKGQIPRQGMNTGGLNDVFFLESSDSVDDVLSQKVGVFKNGYDEYLEIETNFIYPLIHKGFFGGKPPKNVKYVLCLHDNFGKALSADKLQQFPLIWKYIEKHREKMCNRKGVLIRAQISKGLYWALFGVGQYSFSKYKIIWESFGRHEFKSIVVDGFWQGNQSMHAYIPSFSLKHANQVCGELNKYVQDYLKSFGMEGTCNWAQPGRIKRILKECDEQYSLSV